VDKKVWVISEVYSPDEAGGAYFMSKLAEGLGRYNSVNVLCGYPVYTARGATVLKLEIRNGVNVERCDATRFDKNIIVLRLFNLLTISISIFFKALLRIRKQDIVLVVTTPPLLPFLVSLACHLRRAKCILRIDDVYPETLIATGLLRQRNMVARVFFFMNKILYRSFDRIVVLGRDMDQLVKNKLGRSDKHVTIIPNWADVDLVKPASKANNALLRELGLTDKFIIQCAGNMGRAQGIENLFKAVEILKNKKNIHFLFIGSGAKRNWMDREICNKELHNVTILDQRPRSDQGNFLNACDIALVSLLPGMTGAGVPSRLYNIMAAGKPLIAVMGYGAELEFVVNEEEVGWFVPADQPDKLVEVILDARSSPERLLQMGKRARSAAVAKYSQERVINKYRQIVEWGNG
jgi:glycosyltransferase involved in cell wall biosynthesis